MKQEVRKKPEINKGVSPSGVKLSVLIPVYNEKHFLEDLLRQVRAVAIRKEIILVDDCSTDGTTEILRRMEAGPEGRGDALNSPRFFYHDWNQGKGAAIRTGLKQVSGDIVIIQDADLEYDPAEYPALIEPILSGRADVVYGTRFLGKTHRSLFFWHYAANRFLTTFSNICTNLNLTDMETCYKVFKAEYAPKIVLKSDRFGFDPEITARLARLKCRFYEVPISYYGRDYSEGKKITWRDGFVVIWAIIKYNLIKL
jgi:glycosyltransferase involved in cell wall biosynthesis